MRIVVRKCEGFRFTCIMVPMRCTCLALLLVLASCDDTTTPPPPRRDAGPPADAGTMDGGDGDGGGPMDDAGDRDGATGFDGGELPDGGVPTCTASEDDRHVLGTDPGGFGRIVGMDAAHDSWGIVWNETRDGVPDVFGVRLTPSGPGTVQQITDQFSRENPPSVLANGSEWIAAWVDNDESVSFEVRTQTLGSSLAPVGERHRLTSTDALLEDSPTLINLSSGPFLFFIEDDMVASTRTAKAVPLNLDGSAAGTPQTVSMDGQRPGQVALGELEAGPVVFWSEGIGATQDLLLQGMTDEGARRGSPTTVTSESNADGTVDAALVPDLGGAVVFGVVVGGVRREVRFRALDGAGAFSSDERSLLTPPATGTDASITRFAGGFAVAYRGDDGSGSTSIRLLLVDALGDVLADVPVSAAQPGGGRVTIRATTTRQLAVAWADDVGDGVEIVAQIIRCGS